MSRSRWRNGSIILPNSGAFFCRGFWPLLTRCEGAHQRCCPLYTPPRGGRSAPPHPGGLSRRGESPQRRARGHPWTPEGDPSEKCFTFRSRSPCGSRTPSIGFQPQNRPICHFGLVGKSVFFSPQATPGAHPQLSIRGTAGGFGFCVLPGVAPLSGGSNACVAGG